MQELFAVAVILRKLDDGFLVLADQPGGEHQESGADGVQRGREVGRGQTEPFEPMDGVGGQQEELEERDISGPALRRDLAQRGVVEELPDVLLNGGPGGGEPIGPPGAGGRLVTNT